MSREILFKAKRVRDGKWLEGYYIHHIKRTIYPVDDEVRIKDEEHVMARDGFSDWGMPLKCIMWTERHTKKLQRN